MADELNEQKIKVVPKSTPEIGIDTEGEIVDNVIAATQVGALDVSSIDALTASAQTREQNYELMDSMANDDTVSAVLKQYASDMVQTNEKGQIMWIESSDPNVYEHTSWLLNQLNIEQKLYPWAYCLITYGDLYVRLYRQSDKQDDILYKKRRSRKLNEALYGASGDDLSAVEGAEQASSKEQLKESVNIRIYAKDDHYIPYVQMVDNPGEMFDLQRFGKTHGYIRTPIRMVSQTTDEMYNYRTRYSTKEKDVEIFDAMSFVHAALENTAQRQPETIDIYTDDVKQRIEEYDEYDVKREPTETELEEYEASLEESTTSFTVKRGQSLLYNAFRIWRELNLLEMSALLNRLTQSSVVRILNIQVGSMPKEQVQNYIARLKEKIEQKTALAANTSMQEYQSTGAIINTIYVPQYGDKGTITATTIGGDFDPKSLTDIEYFRDKLFGALGVPKQFFGFTGDGAGFDGGKALTILSAQYGNEIKKLQSIMCQFVTNILHLFLIDRKLDNYVGKFKVRMQAPETQVDIDRRTNADNKIRYVGDIMQQLTDVDDKVVKLKLYKELIGSAINNGEFTSILGKYIEGLEGSGENATAAEAGPNSLEAAIGGEPLAGGDDLLGGDIGGDIGVVEPPAETPAGEEAPLPSPEEIPMESFTDNSDKDILTEDGQEDAESSYMPTGEELGIDLTK